MFAFLLAVTCILGTVCPLSLNRHVLGHQWEQFKIQHNKSYENPEEDYYRMTVFKDNMKTILNHNERHRMGLTTYTMDMNHFGDLTDDEFQRHYLMSDQAGLDVDDYPNNLPVYHETPSRFPLPISVDWRQMGAVTEVKNQGYCNGCYAFSATGALEGQHYLATKELISLSEQNILDCTYMQKEFFNRGCKGGRVDNAFKYIIKNGGIDTEKSYPYQGQTKRCNFDATTSGATMRTFKLITKGNETDLQAAVALIGPVSVMIDAKLIKFYAGGLFDNPKCSSTEYNHGMLVVGYGRWKNLDYWLLKNSWGANWGEGGYIIMRRNRGNQCAIATAALYPVV